MTSSPASHPLKIAFVVDRFGNRYGGAEAYGVEVMRELAARHEITVFAREYDPECDLRLPFVRIKAARGLPSWLRVLWFAVRVRQATRHRFDIVHSHTNGYCGDVEVVHVTPVRYNWRVRRRSWLKRITSWVSPRVQTYLRLENARLRPRPGHRAVGVSDLIAEQLREAYGREREYPVIPPGVCRPTAADGARRIAMRARFDYAGDDCVCLLVARNPMRKGLPTVLQALAALPKRYRLLVVGANTAAREHLQKRPDSALLAGRVEMVDETSDVAPYYLAADIYVHPTLNDSFGMAPLEAMSYELPVILSPAPWCGFAQYVEPNTEALLLSHPEAHDELAAAIERIATDTELLESLREGGSRVVERHSWAEVARRYEELYRACLAERSARDT